jgi:hypothetical protein
MTAKQKRKRAYNRAYRKKHRRKLLAHSRAYYLAHIEEKRAIGRAYGRAHKKKRRAYDRAYRKANKQKTRIRKRIYYQANAEERRAYNRAWNKAHPESRQASIHRRLARIEDNSRSFTPQEWIDLKTKYGHRCLACGRTEAELRRLGRKLVPDHVVPIAWKGKELRGHRGEINNIQPLCHGRGGCNNQKACTVQDYR